MMDKDAAYQAYEDVRSDNSETNWTVLKYDSSNSIIVDSTGVDYAEFVDKFSDNERGFAFVRVETGDEMSKRKKFALVTFIGSGVGALKRARCSTDKSKVKEVFKSFAVEILTSEKLELKIDRIKDEVVKAGGANYGTGC
ncbi:coactosin-like protein [Ylistrum balloti]|uniref:coactosin-like protein n=1 Tax=Ylistrum balloti TaxID=509963 RepID=UPI00290582EA|nr:coactosin-like protein [Ylistrum balloti]